MKRLISWLLVLAMAIACLPMSAFAVEIDDTDPDVDVGFEELLPGYAADDPIDLTADLLNEGDFSATVTVPAGKTMYFIAYRVGGMNMTINDGEAVACVTEGMMYPYAWSIANDGEAEAEYTIKVAFPEGHQANPVVVEYLDGEFSIAENASDLYYFYSYTAPADGFITVYITSITEGVEGDIILTNQNTYEQKTLLNDGVDNNGMEVSIDVNEGDVIDMQFVTVPVDGVSPAADIAWMGMFNYPVGSENNPIAIEWTWNENETIATATVTVEADGTYYAGISGMELTVGGVATEMSETGTFALNAGTYELVLSTPEGAWNNPAQLVIGENTATVAAGSWGGYMYTWTAEVDGTLSLTMPSDQGWFYVINNTTAGTYGDGQWSDSDPVVNPGTIEVAAGDVLSIEVNTYNPEDPYNNPGGTVTFTAAFEAAPEKFAWSGVSVELKDSLSIKFVFSDKFLTGTDNYAVISKEVYNKDTDSVSIEEITIPQSEWSWYSESNGLRQVAYNGIAAKMMMDNLTIVIYNAKGQAISQSYTRSMQDYLYGRLTANISQVLKDLAVDFLNYGAACQTMFTYRPNELANANLTDAQKAFATTDDDIAHIKSEQVVGKMAGLAVSAEYEIVPSFVYKNADLTNVAYAIVSYTTIKGVEVSKTVAINEFGTYNASMKKIEIRGIAVADCAAPVTVTLHAADDTVISTSVDCVNFYAVRQSAKDPAYVALLKLIYSAGIAFA